MAKRYTMAVHDMNGVRICSLYDSKVPQDGAAYGIRIHKEISGWKELSFNLSKYMRIREQNFRCDFIRNEHLLYLTEDDKTDVYCIKAPSELHDSSKIQFTVSCNHISEELKTKNLYKYFDDLNGIGTCEELIERAIRGSGWKLVSCDTFFESDGMTEKVRSYTCEAKTGAYNMIAGICELFDARPEFDGYKKEIRIKALTNTEGWMEILYGKNMDKIKRTLDSSNLVTRLFVEGEYGDFGYVGIDDVPANESGLPFILNFDYFKELGTFTGAHQTIVDDYLKKYKNHSASIQAYAKDMLEKQAELNKLIGNYGYAYYAITGESIPNKPTFTGDGVSDEDAKLSAGDTIYIVQTTGSFEERKFVENDTYSGKCVLKFDPTFTGTVAANRDIAKAAEKAIESYLQKLNRNLRLAGAEEVTVAGLKAIYKTTDLSLVNDDGFNLDGVAEQYKSKDILEYAASIGDSEKTVSASTGAMNADMKRAIELMPMINTANGAIELETGLLEDLDDEFSSRMGSMLKDGYWNDSNYTVGQEESLYNDALEISKKLAYPAVTYDVSIQNLSVLPKYDGEEFKLAQTVRMYDPDMDVNDHGIVSEMDIYPDKPKSDSIKIKTDILDIGTKSFASILERITEMAEQVRRNRDVYRRASAISKDGTIHSNILEGAIDVMKTQLLSSASNWRTDENGNILFTSLDGKTAMMLCGGGFMIANSQNEDGTWNWRTFGTGDGFAADLIVTGFLSADRIEAKSITVNHLASDVGEKLDITSNKGIDFRVEKIIGKDIVIGDEPLTPEEGALWLDTSGEKNVLKKWNGTSWEEVTDISAEELGRLNNLAFTMDGETGEIKTVAQYVSDVDTKASEISQKADQIYAVVESEEGKTEISFTSNAIEAMSGSIKLESNKDLSLISKKIDFIVKGENETSISLAENGIKAISENIDITANKKLNLMSKEIDFIVQSDDELGTNITLTDKMIDAVSKNIKITADSIDLTANKQFNIVSGKADKVEQSIASSSVEFCQSGSSSVAPDVDDPGWQTTAPQWEDGKYMWMRVTTISVDGKTVKRSDATCISGANGADGQPGSPGSPGAPGDPGISISKVTQEYCKHTSNTTEPTSGWQTTQPNWEKGYYIWVRFKITYSDNSIGYTNGYYDETWETVNDVANKVIDTGASEPLNPVVGKIWMDTGSTPNLLRKWNGKYWEAVNDIDEIEKFSAQLAAQQDEMKKAINELATALTVDTTGVHIYKPNYQDKNEVRINQDSVDIIVGGNVASSFIAGGLILGDYMLWHPEAAGGLAFNLV